MVILNKLTPNFTFFCCFDKAVTGFPVSHIRTVKTKSVYDIAIPSSFVYDMNFLNLNRKIKKSGLSVQHEKLPEQDYVFYHSLKNTNKNYILSKDEKGLPAYDFSEQMSVMLPSSNLEEAEWRKLLQQKSDVVQASNYLALSTQLSEIKNYQKERDFYNSRIDKFISVVESSTHEEQISFIEKELASNRPSEYSSLSPESKVWCFDRLIALEQQLYSINVEHLRHMRARALTEHRCYEMFKGYLETQKEILLSLKLAKLQPLPQSISDSRPLGFKSYYDITSSETKRIAEQLEKEADKISGPPSAEVLETRKAQALVVEKAIRKSEANDALRAAGLEVPAEFTVAVKPQTARPILRATTKKNADGTSTFDTSSSSSASVSSATSSTSKGINNPEATEGFFSSLASKVTNFGTDFSPVNIVPTSVLGFAWDIKSLASGRGPYFPTVAVRPTSSGDESLSKTEKEEIVRKAREANAILDAREAKVKAERAVETGGETGGGTGLGVPSELDTWGLATDAGVVDVPYGGVKEKAVDTGAGTGLSGTSELDTWGLATDAGVVDVPYGGVKEKAVDTGAGTGFSKSLLEFYGQDIYNFFIVLLSSNTINSEMILGSIGSIIVWMLFKQVIFYILPLTKKYHMFKVYSVLSFFYDKF